MSIVLQEISHQYVAVEELVEGVDYEKYDWLKGDGLARINTKLVIEDYKIVSLTANIRDIEPYSKNACYVFGCGTYADYKGFGCYVAAKGGTFVKNNQSNGGSNIVSVSGSHVIEVKNGEWYGDGQYKTNAGYWNPAPTKTLHLFGWQSGSDRSVKGYFGNFSIDGIISLSPCQLIQPIPAKLDSQGIARAAGECGMIDSVSGKFYGNANTTGAFSVYND